MKAKEYFATVQMLEADIERTVERINRLSSLLDVCAQSYTPHTPSQNSSDMLDKIVEISQLKDYFSNLLDGYIEKMKRTEKVLNQFANPQVKHVMNLYYISNVSVRDIAQMLNISKSKAHRLLEQGNIQDIDVHMCINCD